MNFSASELKTLPNSLNPESPILGLSTPPPSSSEEAAMSDLPPPVSDPPPPPPRRLMKQSTWSPDLYREEAWVRRKGRANRRTKSVTEEDLDELKACFELGFGFASDLDPKLSDAFPAYDLYHAVNRHYNDAVSNSSSDFPSPPIFSPGEDPKRMKMRLRQWAQVVACSVKHSCN